MVRLLSDDDIATVLDLEALLPVVADAFRKQTTGEVERPERPHYPFGAGLETDTNAGETIGEPNGTGLCMPAYVHGADYVATKLATVVEDNPERGLPTVTAQIALADAETGQPVGYLAGNRITSARTGCIGGLAARELAPGTDPLEVGVIGAGTQARWQTRAIAAAVDREIASVRVYSPSDSRLDCAEDLDAELAASVTAVSSPREAVEEASVVVTATTSTEPVFPGDALEPPTLVIAIGAYTPEMRELDAETIERAERIVADVPEEALETGDLREAPDPEYDIEPLGEVLVQSDDQGSGDESATGTGTVVLESVGSAVLDAAAAAVVFDRALDRDVGTTVSL
ncbi:ornithine cyclodeaminase family protein [Halobiforma nitratireducens]|uniref:Ornithine cyclodeaminase n=1 Tax=Halobiforma nitratireducens JCM 10879 TaxID=1227454 RepID=M0M2A4_9EURY|nr:ornithine cyclodeaminase family protein [Halobiforma nitratireducens]EMA38739.1 ornithine cyclodeaminase [Halobiforma nitratireducens JCM 10879]